MTAASDSRGVHVPEGAGSPAAPGEGLPRASAMQGRDEAAAIYAALRRSGAGFPAFWEATKAKLEERCDVSSSAATPSWPERVIVDGREIPVVIDPASDQAGVVEWNSDFTNNPTTPERIVLRGRDERVLLHEVLHCLLGDNEALVRRATLLYDLGWRLSRG